MTANTTQTKLMLQTQTPCGCMFIIKLWEHLPHVDLDEDGTKYHRGLLLCQHSEPEPFKLKVEDYEMYVSVRLQEGWKILV